MNTNVLKIFMLVYKCALCIVDLSELEVGELLDIDIYENRF